MNKLKNISLILILAFFVLMLSSCGKKKYDANITPICNTQSGSIEFSNFSIIDGDNKLFDDTKKKYICYMSVKSNTKEFEFDKEYKVSKTDDSKITGNKYYCNVNNITFTEEEFKKIKEIEEVEFSYQIFFVEDKADANKNDTKIIVKQGEFKFESNVKKIIIDSPSSFKKHLYDEYEDNVEYIINQDIDFLNSRISFDRPLGNKNNYIFRSKLFGQGKTISNLEFNFNDNNVYFGIFGINEGLITDLNFKNTKLNINKIKNDCYVGTYCAINRGKLEKLVSKSVDKSQCPVIISFSEKEYSHTINIGGICALVENEQSPSLNNITNNSVIVSNNIIQRLELNLENTVKFNNLYIGGLFYKISSNTDTRCKEYVVSDNCIFKNEQNITGDEIKSNEEKDSKENYLFNSYSVKKLTDEANSKLYEGFRVKLNNNVLYSNKDFIDKYISIQTKNIEKISKKVQLLYCLLGKVLCAKKTDLDQSINNKIINQFNELSTTLVNIDNFTDLDTNLNLLNHLIEEILSCKDKSEKIKTILNNLSNLVKYNDLTLDNIKNSLINTNINDILNDGQFDNSSVDSENILPLFNEINISKLHKNIFSLSGINNKKISNIKIALSVYDLCQGISNNKIYFYFETQKNFIIENTNQDNNKPCDIIKDIIKSDDNQIILNNLNELDDNDDNNKKLVNELIEKTIKIFFFKSNELNTNYKNDKDKNNIVVFVNADFKPLFDE